jgi:uncharacterized membrane protein (DUF106 family)
MLARYDAEYEKARKANNEERMKKLKEDKE